MFRGFDKGQHKCPVCSKTPYSAYVLVAPGVSDFASVPAFLCDLAVAIHGVLSKIVDIAVAGVPAVVAILDVAAEDGIFMLLPLLGFPFSFQDKN